MEMSDEWLAQLRERWERGDAVGWNETVDTIGEAVQTIAELIDEVERLRKIEAAVCYESDGRFPPSQMAHILAAWERALREDDCSNVAHWLAGVRAALEASDAE